MPYDDNTSLWASNDTGKYWHNLHIDPIRQSGPHCVSTCLGMVSGKPPEYFQGKINTQNPVTWSETLIPFGKKLAYCPSDIRKIEFYLGELIALDDLFLLCYYTSEDFREIMRDPDEDGWICNSHVVILYRDQIIDPAKGSAIQASEHSCRSSHTKRIFRIVPASSTRGL